MKGMPKFMSVIEKNTEKYDIFLSYRRDGGETMAILLRDRLTAKGYNVFLDVESLNSGKFNTKLLRIIEECTDMIVVLSPGSLDRCTNDGDWVRLEIAHAFKHGKNIVPIMLRGFQWPQSLPEDIEELSMQNGVNANNNEFFDAAIDRLMSKFLLSRPMMLKGKKLSWLKWAGPVAAVLIAALVLFFVLNGRDNGDPGLSGDGNPSSGVTDSLGSTPPNPQESSTTGSIAPNSAAQERLAASVGFFDGLPLAGNSTGNILNTGFAAGDAQCVFFTDNNFNIYRFEPETPGIALLYTETGKVTSLNYYKGLLYYSTPEAICSLDPFTGARTVLTMTRGEYAFIDDDAIFYFNSFDSLKLYKLSLDGRTNTKLNDLTNLRYRIVSGGSFYFSDNSAGTRLYRSDLDGNNRVELTNQETHWANVLGDNIFYADLGPDPKLAHMRMSGGEPDVISQMPVSCLNVSADGYVYIKGTENSSMFVMSFDGETETRLTDFPVRYINVVSDWIFFCSRDEDDAIYVTKTDGSELSTVNDFISRYPPLGTVAQDVPATTSPSPSPSQSSSPSPSQSSSPSPSQSSSPSPSQSDTEQVSKKAYTIVNTVYSMKTTYTGEWKDGKPNGVGKATATEDVPGRFYKGDILEGTWVNGLIEGPGVYTSGNFQLKGNFIKGLKEGTVEQYQNGVLIGTIEFKNGSPVT